MEATTGTTEVWDPATDGQELTEEEARALGLTDEGNGEEPDNEDGLADEEPQGSTEPQIEGSGQLSLSVGGKKPTSSSLRLVGTKVEVGGNFAKGEVVTLIVEAQVRKVTFVDRCDDAGNVKATERQHNATVVGVERA